MIFFIFANSPEKQRVTRTVSGFMYFREEIYMKKDTYNYLNLCDKTIHFIITRIYLYITLFATFRNERSNRSRYWLGEMGVRTAWAWKWCKYLYSTHFTSNKRLAKTSSLLGQDLGLVMPYILVFGLKFPEFWDRWPQNLPQLIQKFSLSVGAQNRKKTLRIRSHKLNAK